MEVALANTHLPPDEGRAETGGACGRLGDQAPVVNYAYGEFEKVGYTVTSTTTVVKDPAR
ncbi:MAG: hypothetical protein KIT22_04175 [Verrucomicrobiae bacterium]|nr:hypothetical protein [Verrucomicrobiae bacterium]